MWIDFSKSVFDSYMQVLIVDLYEILISFLFLTVFLKQMVKETEECSAAIEDLAEQCSAHGPACVGEDLDKGEDAEAYPYLCDIFLLDYKACGEKIHNLIRKLNGCT